MSNLTLIDVNNASRKNKANRIAKKINNPSRFKKIIKVSGTDTLIDRINNIVTQVNAIFADKKDSFLCITDEEMLIAYCDNIIEYGECAIDVETDGLNPILDNIAGICLYSPNNKSCYVPVNHISYISLERIDTQLSEDIVKRELQRLVDNGVKFYYFNAKFDYKFIKQQWGIEVPINYCGYIAHKLINEHEDAYSLKHLHNTHVKNTKSIAYTFDKIADGIPATHIPIAAFYLYSANDTLLTWELMKWQECVINWNYKDYLDHLDELDDDMVNNINISRHYFEVEIPLLKAVGDMELRGIRFDHDVHAKLKTKYTALLEQEEIKFVHEIRKYKSQIDEYRQNCISQGIKPDIDDPINPNSPAQLSTLLYKILKIKPVFVRKNGQYMPDYSTGVKTLSKLDHPVAKITLNYRKFEKLVNAFINKLPNHVNPITGKIHSNFNQYGTNTGRFSSNEPRMLGHYKVIYR